MSQEQEQKGSFTLGLFIGALLAAVGYFVTHTKEGKELKKSFTEHWIELKNRLIEQGDLSEKEEDIVSYISLIREKILDFLDESDLYDSKKSKRKSGTKKKTAKKRKLFKGV